MPKKSCPMQLQEVSVSTEGGLNFLLSAGTVLEFSFSYWLFSSPVVWGMEFEGQWGAKEGREWANAALDLVVIGS